MSKESSGNSEATGTISAAAELELLAQSTAVFGGRWVAPVAMLVVALTLALNVIPYWIPTPDSALYLSLGRSLARGEGYRVGGIPHTLVLPGFPLILAAVFRTLGENYLVMNLVQALFGMGCVLLTVALFRRWLGLRAAVLLAVLFGMTESLVRWSSRILTDAPHLFFVLLALLLIQEMGRRAHRASRLALALLVGPTMLIAGVLRLNGFLLIPVALAVLFRPREGGLKLGEKIVTVLVWSALIALPLLSWYRYVSHVPADMRNTYLGYATFMQGPGHLLRYTVETVCELPEQLTEALLRNHLTLVPNLLVVVVVGVGLVRLVRHGGWHVVLFVLLQLGLFATQEFSRRYLLVVLPFLVAGFVVGAAYLTAVVGRRRAPGRPSRAAVRGVVLVMLVLNLLPILKWTVEVHRRPFYEKYRGGRWREEVVLAEWMRRNTRARDIFWTGRPIILSYLSDRKVRGPGTPCAVRARELVPPAEVLRRNLRYWSPRYVVLDAREKEFRERVVGLIRQDDSGVRRVDIPGLKRLELLELPVFPVRVGAGPSQQRQLLCDQSQEKGDEAHHDGEHGADADASARQHVRHAPDDSGEDTDDRHRNEDPHRVEQHQDVQDGHDRLEGGAGGHGALARGSPTDLYRRLQHPQSLVEKDQRDDVAEGHGVGTQVETRFRHLGAVDLHPGIDVINGHRHQEFREAAEQPLAEPAVGRRRLLVFPAAHHHVGVFADDHLVQPVHVLETVLSVRVDRHDELRLGGRHPGLHRRTIPPIEFVVQRHQTAFLR